MEIPNFCHHKECKQIAMKKCNFCYIHCCKLCYGDINNIFGICQKCLNLYFMKIRIMNKKCAYFGNDSKTHKCQQLVKNCSVFCIKHSCICGWEKKANDIYCGGNVCTHKGVYL
jgi:hypothetical protein